MRDDYMSSTIEISINEFGEKYIDGKTVTFYKIEIYDNYSKESWFLEKRYSEIDLLHKTLSKLYPNIPPMPGKTLFKIKDREQLEKRKKQLETFLKECAKRKDIESNETFKNFLELDKHSPDLTYNAPTIIYENNELPQGIRDFYFFKEASIMYIVCCDMKIASRLDAYVTNVNLPWEKKTDAHISVGSVFAFKVIVDKKGITHLYEKLWAKSFPEQTGVVNFDEEGLVLQVGLDSGTVIFYKTSKESKYLVYDELCRIKPHNARVMGLDFDSKSGYIYSCGTDKKFMLSEINYLSNVTEIAQSNSGYTNLEFDKVNERIFLTNESGILSVFLTNTFPPTLVNVIQTHSIYCIRGLDIDYTKQYIFTGTTKGDISVFELGAPGKEKLIKEISFFGGNIEIRIIRFNPDDRELYTGDQQGKITVWSLKSGQSIYAWQAHADAITQMEYFPKTRQLLSMAKDKKIIYWQIPDNWVSDSIKKFQDEKVREINNTRAIERLQKSQKKEGDDDDSSDDSLDGWELRP
jgi:WD40 repeat protein